MNKTDFEQNLLECSCTKKKKINRTLVFYLTYECKHRLLRNRWTANNSGIHTILFFKMLHTIQKQYFLMTGYCRWHMKSWDGLLDQRDNLALGSFHILARTSKLPGWETTTWDPHRPPSHQQMAPIHHHCFVPACELSPAPGQAWGGSHFPEFDSKFRVWVPRNASYFTAVSIQCVRQINVKFWFLHSQWLTGRLYSRLLFWCTVTENSRCRRLRREIFFIVLTKGRNGKS